MSDTEVAVVSSNEARLLVEIIKMRTDNVGEAIGLLSCVMMMLQEEFKLCETQEDFAVEIGNIIRSFHHAHIQ